MSNPKVLLSGVFVMLLGITLLSLYIMGYAKIPLVFAAGILTSAVGLAIVAVGFISVLGYEYMPKDTLRAGDANVFTVALIRCMVAISVADNVLDDEEVTEVIKIYKHLTQNNIGEEIVREIAADMMENQLDIANELATVADTLDKTHKEKLILASLYILAADGDMDEGELTMLDDIRLGLNMSLRHVEKMKTEFLSGRTLRAV